MRKNVFLMGLDDFNRRQLASLDNVERYAFHALLSTEEVIRPEQYAIEEMLAKAERQLARFPGPVDAVGGYNDFPVSEMVPYLCEELGLPSPSLRSVIACEHKFWCRTVLEEAVPECTPAFQAVDPFIDDAAKRLELPYPFWLKPVKSHSSHLGFLVEDDRSLRSALDRIQEGIGRIAEPFDHMLRRVRRPPALERIDGHHCVAEALIGGRQCTLEGYVWRGDVRVYGVVDSVRFDHVSSFRRYQYPSRLPGAVQRRMIDAAERAIRALGLNDSPFNIEFFWDEGADRVWLLEVNPRISESHCDLFRKVDGRSHHQVMVQLALGEAPDFRRGQGEFGCAAKLFVRHFQDGRVVRVPSTEEIRQVERRFPGTLVKVAARQGMWLSELRDQDSYSFELAVLFMGAESEDALLARYEEARAMLPFEIEPR